MPFSPQCSDSEITIACRRLAAALSPLYISFLS